MSDKKVQKLVVSALMAALTYVATMVVQIPSPMNGYVNLGDCFVLLSRSEEHTSELQSR